jgi:hypothetical protein
VALPFAARPQAGADPREALSDLWAGMYDISEELITGAPTDSPLAPLHEQERVQVNVRRVSLPWLGTHVLYVEEYPYEDPFEIRRRVLLDIEPPDASGTLRVRQYTRRPGDGDPASFGPEDVETQAGCDLFLKREGSQFRGGTRERQCLDDSGEKRWLDYRVVIGDGLFWYRLRRLTMANDEVVEEIAGIPHVDLADARLFSCGMTWAARGKEDRLVLPSVDLHDRGGRARFRTPDGRSLLLELHGRDRPLATGRESLVLVLREDGSINDSIASSWTSLDAARVGIDIGWLTVDCAPVVAETGEQRS